MQWQSEPKGHCRVDVDRDETQIRTRAVRRSSFAAMAVDARQIRVQIDNLLDNPVLAAGPEQHETKEPSVAHP